MIAAAHNAYPDFSIRQLCAAVGAGRTWWYTRPSADAVAQRDTALRDAIERIVLELPGYGYRRSPERFSATGGRSTTSGCCGSYAKKRSCASLSAGLFAPLTRRMHCAPIRIC